MPSSERMRDPRFRKRKLPSVYGTNRGKIVRPPKVNVGGGKTKAKGGKVSTAALGAALGNVAPPPISIEQILARDPYLQASRAQRQAESIADAASRDAAIRRAFIDFGYAPPGLSSDAIDPTTRALAEKNTAAGMSIWARLADAAKIQQRDVVNSVGARGLFRSGETSYGLQRSQLAADQGRYDAIKEYNDYVAGIQAAFAESERARLAAEAAAQQQAVTEGEPVYNLGAPMPPPWTPPAGAAPMPTNIPIPFGALFPKKPQPKPNFNVNAQGQRIGGV